MQIHALDKIVKFGPDVRPEANALCEAVEICTWLSEHSMAPVASPKVTCPACLKRTEAFLKAEADRDADY